MRRTMPGFSSGTTARRPACSSSRQALWAMTDVYKRQPCAVTVHQELVGVVGVIERQRRLAGGLQRSVAVLDGILGAVFGLGVGVLALKHDIGDGAITVQVHVVIIRQQIISDRCV